MKILSIILLLTLSLFGCSATQEKTTTNCEVSEKKISYSEKYKDSSIDKDKDVEEFLSPYRKELVDKTDKTLAELKIDLRHGSPEGTLGRFASTIILEKAREYSEKPVDFSVLNRGGLRKEIFKGDFKVRDAYELMPFDNYIVRLSISGDDVEKICSEIAKNGGMPVSNLQIKYEKSSGKQECRVNNESIDKNRVYYIATINYLYQVGEGIPTIKKAKPEDMMYQRLFRDAIIEYARDKKVLDGFSEKNIVISE
ncbi:5'-nucleotidase C-terminal domain-containing protein [bacterium]|nr:5'-nucleotidase C-terminal domain-containing protein [bacterium]